MQLKTRIDKNSGFCFGVTGAIDKAEEELNKNHELYCLGEIVHNDEEIKRLEAKGLKIITKEGLIRLKNKRILFRAHGEPPSSYEIASQNNNRVIDASCPIILKLQKKIKKSFENKEHIYIFGKKDHPEIIGLNGQIDNQAVVFESIEELNRMEIEPEITLYSQTTQSLSRFREIIDFLMDSGIKVNVMDTICRAVSNRLPEIRKFCAEMSKVIFVAGKNSANGRMLFHGCKEMNSNAFFISSIEEIRKSWFTPGETVGICGATSTPQWLLKEVEDYINNL